MKAGNVIYLRPKIVHGTQPIITELNNVRVKKVMY